MKKKINFRKISVEIDYDGNTVESDVSKTLSQSMFDDAANYDDHELGRLIHLHGEVEVSKEQAETIKKYVNERYFRFFAVRSITKALDNLFINN